MPAPEAETAGPGRLGGLEPVAHAQMARRARLAVRLAKELAEQPVRAGARRHALRLAADEPAGAALRRDRRAEQRVDLLRPGAGRGRRLVLRVLGGDRHLG